MNFIVKLFIYVAGDRKCFLLIFFASIMRGVIFAATPEIRNVKAFQQYPWGKVYITYEVEGDIAASAKNGETPLLVIEAKDKATGKVIMCEPAYGCLSGDVGAAVGVHTVVWDIGAQGVAINSADVTFTVMYCDEVYLVVDLSDGANASRYPVSYLYSVPLAGWTDEYKMTKLVLRRIPAGTFIMGQDQTDESHRVTLSNPFYCGVFEVTQKQYELVAGDNPSKFIYDNAMRPVENVSYDMIRGPSAGAGWPGSSAVDGASFIGKIQNRTGLNFDLPTEAQWEYACRAGTMTDYNNGKNGNGNMYEVGRYCSNGGWNYWDGFDGNFNVSSRNGTAKVGSYQQNAWGLYDMHGNVWEQCLDRHGDLVYGVDPRGPSSGSIRVVRGGCWNDAASSCTAYIRDRTGWANNSYGFRLVRTMPK